MSFSRVLKLVVGTLFVVVTDPTLAYAAISRLPKGCENYRLVHGDINTATIFLLGEKHGDICTDARVKCSAGLLKKVKAKKSSTAILFENIGYDQRVLCQEYGVEHLSDNCYGWNIKHKDLLEKDRHQHRAKGLELLYKNIEDNFNTIMKTVSIAQQKVEVLRYLDGLIHTYFSQKIQSLQKRIKSMDPEVYSLEHVNLRLTQIARDEAINFRNRIKKSNSVSKKSYEYLKAEKEKEDNLHLTITQDLEQLIAVPNQHLSKSIQSSIKKQKHVIAYAGAYHVDNTMKHKKMAQDLYNDLNQFAHENPFAVLTCNP